MAEITLAYKDEVLTDLSKSGVESECTDYESFDTVESFKPKRVNETIENSTLRGRLFKHTKHRRRHYTFVISSNELDDEHGTDIKEDFLEDFWDAEYKYLYLHDGTHGEAYVEVESSDDELQRTYINGIYFMPEITLNLYKVRSES